MFAALTLSQTLLVRASMDDCDEDQRFCVLSPSVKMMSTLSRSLAKAGALNGATGIRSWKPQAMPMVTLVLPVGVIASTLALSAVQSSDSGIIGTGQPLAWCARNSVAGLPARGTVAATSLFWSR